MSSSRAPSKCGSRSLTRSARASRPSVASMSDLQTEPEKGGAVVARETPRASPPARSDDAQPRVEMREPRQHQRTASSYADQHAWLTDTAVTAISMHDVQCRLHVDARPYSISCWLWPAAARHGFDIMSGRAPAARWANAYRGRGERTACATLPRLHRVGPGRGRIESAGRREERRRRRARRSAWP